MHVLELLSQLTASHRSERARAIIVFAARMRRRSEEKTQGPDQPTTYTAQLASKSPSLEKLFSELSLVLINVLLLLAPPDLRNVPHSLARF